MIAIVIFSLFSLSPFNSENFTTANIYFVKQSITKKLEIAILLQYKYVQILKIANILQSKYFLFYIRLGLA